jgi:hypothetical protein
MGIAAPTGVDVDRCATADRWTAALEFLHGQIDALPIQRVKGALEAVLGHQADQVPVLAAGEAEEPSIGALRAVVDAAASQLEKIDLATLESLPQNHPGLVHRDRSPESRGKPGQEPRSGDQLLEGGQPGSA